MWHLTILAFYGIFLMAIFGVAGMFCAGYEYHQAKKRDRYLATRRITIMQDFS